MKHGCFVCVLLCLTTTFLLSQPNSVPLINQTTRVVSPINVPEADPKTEANILDSYGKLPLTFEVNEGQTDARVKFVSRRGESAFFLTADEAVLTLRESMAKTVQVSSGRKRR